MYIAILLQFNLYIQSGALHDLGILVQFSFTNGMKHPRLLTGATAMHLYTEHSISLRT